MNAFLENQKSMYSYHASVSEPHPYASTWQEWMIDGRPIWYHYQDVGLGNGKISTISAFGNPIIWWSGIAALVYTIWLTFRKKDKISFFLLLGYITQLVPWIFIARTKFIYHYFPLTPFLMLMLVNAAWHCKKNQKQIIYGFSGAALLLFILFFPVLSGVPVLKSYVANVLSWFQSWVFYIG